MCPDCARQLCVKSFNSHTNTTKVVLVFFFLNKDQGPNNLSSSSKTQN